MDDDDKEFNPEVPSYVTKAGFEPGASGGPVFGGYDLTLNTGTVMGVMTDAMLDNGQVMGDEFLVHTQTAKNVFDKAL